MTTPIKTLLELPFDPFGTVYSYLPSTDKMSLFSSHRTLREKILATIVSEGSQTISPLVRYIPLAPSEAYLLDTWMQFRAKATKPGYFVILTVDRPVHPIKELSSCKSALLNPFLEKLRTLSFANLLNLPKLFPRPTFSLINSTKNQLLTIAKSLKNQELAISITGDGRRSVVVEKIVVALANQGLPLESIFSIFPKSTRDSFLFTKIFKTLLEAGYIYRAKAWFEDPRNNSMHPSKPQELISFYKDIEDLAKELFQKQDTQGGVSLAQSIPSICGHPTSLFFTLFKRLSCIKSTTLLLSQFIIFTQQSSLDSSTSLLADGSFSEPTFEIILAFAKGSNPNLGHIGPDLIFWVLSRSMTQKGCFQKAIELTNAIRGRNENTQAVQEILDEMLHLKIALETILETFSLISNPAPKLCFALKLSTTFPADFGNHLKKIINDIFVSPNFQEFPLFLKKSEIESDVLRSFLVNFFRYRIDLLKKIGSPILTTLVLTDLTVTYVAEKNLQQACKMAFYLPGYREQPHLFIIIAEGFLQSPIEVLEMFWGNPGLFSKDKKINSEDLTLALSFDPKSAVLGQLFHLLICNALLKQQQVVEAKQVLCQLGSLYEIDSNIYSSKLYALVVTEIWRHLPSQEGETLIGEAVPNPLEFYMNLVPKDHFIPHLPTLMKNGNIEKAAEFVAYETNNENWNSALLKTFNFHLANSNLDKAISILNKFNNHFRAQALSYLSSHLAKFPRPDIESIIELALANKKITQEERSSIFGFIKIFKSIENGTPVKTIQELSEGEIDPDILSSIFNLSAIYLAECNQIDRALEFASHILPESREVGDAYEVIILKILEQDMS